MIYEKLIERLKKDTCVLHSSRLEKAFRAVDRRFFVPKELQDEVYKDYPLPIGYGATISQPTTVAFMLEKLDVWEGQTVLDIGSGSGWTTALLARLVGQKGKVIGLEIITELIALSDANLHSWYSDVLKNNRTPVVGMPKIRQARREIAGLLEEAPYDRILVSAAAREIPKGLIEQLKPDGVMVIPVGNEGEAQKIVRIRKRADGTLETEEYPGFVFVSLR